MHRFFAFSAGIAALLMAPAAWAQATHAKPVRSDEAFAVPAFVQDYDPKPAIWKLADEDTTIYLFGTFHVLPDGFRWRSARFDSIVEDADELVIETSDADSEAGSQALMVRVLSEMKDRVPTSKRLSPEAGEKWLALAEVTEMPPAIFDRMPPMLAIMAAGVGQLDMMGSESENGVETILQSEFAEAGKPIGSIEDSNDVLTNILSIDEDLLLAQLETDLIAWNGEDSESFFLGDGEDADGLDLALEHEWAKGEEIDDLDFGEGEFGVLFEKILLEDRNRAWAGWLDKRLDRPGIVLVAVGAGHFFGPTSVQAMLAERGLSAERID